MRKLLAILVLIVWCSGSISAQQSDLVPITYLQSSVVGTDSELFRLMDGSQWIRKGHGIILPASEITIIITSEKGEGITFINGQEMAVELVRGTPILSKGLLGQVLRERGSGAILELSDGSLWEIPVYDRYDTGYWLPPYWIIVSADELYLINPEKGKKVWASRIR